MEAIINAQRTMAEKYVAKINESAMLSALVKDKTLAVSVAKNMGCLVIGEIVDTQENPIGKRYLFNDNSFVDFYYNASHGCFFGVSAGGIKSAFNDKVELQVLQ